MSKETYLKQIRRLPLLSRDEELALARRIKNGDEVAREKLIMSNIRIVVSLARRYVHVGVPLLDLIQEGNIGLIKAVERYDHTRGYKFSTYATYWVKNAILRCLADSGRIIRIPAYMTENVIRYKRSILRLREEKGREPTMAEIANELGISQEDAVELHELSETTASLDSIVDSNRSGDGVRLGDTIEDPWAVNPKEELAKELRSQFVQRLLNQLSEREMDMIKFRYGFADGEPHTTKETGKKFGVSRERIRQIEAKALNKLKKHMLSKEIDMCLI